jgi:S-adenosylmethionine decarboxylase
MVELPRHVGAQGTETDCGASEPSPGGRAAPVGFNQEDGVLFAGTHLLLELWGADRLDDAPFIERTLVKAAEAASATVLEVRLHTFEPCGGVTGVLLLAESHISIHSWPERGYAAIDLFMCGKCNPHLSVPVLQKAFKPDSVEITEHKRGCMLD